jgi:hypothetical protein
VLAQHGGEASKADVPGVQQALIALQEKSLVWKAARGVYDLEETATDKRLMAQAGLLDNVPDAELPSQATAKGQRGPK